MFTRSDELILNWLNEEIKLDPPVENIIKEFYNGYRFGEILYNINEITEEQFNEFSNSSTIYLIKDNFTLLKKYFKEKFELEVRKEEFNDIMNKHISKAVVILYKLKNSILKKKIHFHNIRISLNDLTQDEINKKVKDIIDYEYFRDIFNKDILNDIINEENIFNDTNKFQFTSTVKSYKSSSKFNLSNFSYHNTISTERIDESPELRIRLIYSKNHKNELSPNNLHEKYQSTEYTLNDSEKKDKKSKKILPNIFSNINKSNALSPNKNMLTNTERSIPFTVKKSNLFLTSSTINNNIYETKYKFGDGKTNKAKENQFKITTLKDALFKFGLNNFQSNFKNNLQEFNSNNNSELNKIRNELKNKLHLKKSESTKKENFKKKYRFKLFENPTIDFIHKEKNPLYRSQLPIGIHLQEHNKYLTYLKRVKYAKELRIYNKQRQIEKKMKFYSSYIEKSQKIDKKEEKDDYFFDENIFLQNLNVYNLESFNNFITKKRMKLRKDFSIIKNIVLLIIELTMEIFFYEEENQNKLIDIKTFNKLLELFINNKPMRERVVDADARVIKERYRDNEIVNADKLILTNEEQNLKEDYKNYVGLWNDDKIIDKEFRGMKVDFAKINSFYPPDYEPTEADIEDLSFPFYNVENYIYGDIILDLMENKFMNKNRINISNEIGKWDHIDYKISLIGLPFCGKKFISNEIVKKYQNLKIYSVQKILRNYCNQYKTILEPIENHPKFKSMKKNQIEQLKEDKENQLKEFEPILKIIQPYLDTINQNNIIYENQNEKENEENKINNNLIIPSDEVLLNIIIYNIENDFPKLSEEEIKNEIINNQTNISNLLKQKETLQKQIQESKKPNPKDEHSLLNIEKEIQTIKDNSVKGFIIIDFPTNINQCNLLEHYLTGYIDETKKPKTQKMINIQSINSLIDFNFLPPENNKLKKSGIDFIINIISNEEEINERFNKKKYDPLNDKIYSEYELSLELANNKDKKFSERLVDDIPYFTKEHFDYYKKEYYENISKISLFYNMFGFMRNNIGSDLNLLNIENSESINKTYKEISTKMEEKEDSEDSESSVSNSIEEKIDEKNKNNDIKNNININKNNNANNNKNNTKNKNKEIPEVPKREEEIKKKIFDFINNNIIEFLYNKNIEKNQKIFYIKNSELNDDEQKDIIKFEPDIIVNEIKKFQSFKLLNKEKMVFRQLTDNFDIVLSDLKSFNIKYEKHIGKFIHLIKKQKKIIYDRLNLIQKKYRDFLNHKTDKRSVINIYINQYNSFFSEFPNAFYSSIALNEFASDINDLNSALWVLINIKETVSIKELQEIKNSNFIEYELKKFFNYIKDVFLLETEKFLVMINSIINLYQRKNDENTSSILNIIINKKNKDKNKKLDFYKKEFILRNLKELSEQNLIFDENKVNENDNKDNSKNKDVNKNRRIFYKRKNKTNSIDYEINKNIEIIFNNCINVILAQEERIENLLKSIKESVSFSTKKALRFKKKQANDANGSSTISGFSLIKESGTNLEENIRKIFQNEKNKYKYRISFLRSFVSKYMIIVIQTSIKIFQNIDNWIIKSVTLQSEAQNTIIRKLKSILKEKRLINEEKDINTIELDSFGKLNNNEKNNNKKRLLEERLEKIYQNLSIDYFLEDNFINIEIKEDKETNKVDDDEDQKEDLKKKNKMVLKYYKMIIPADLRSKINDIILSNIDNRISNKFPDNYFHYNIDKFQGLYNKIKRYEIKKDTISEDLFYEIFIKKYIYNKDIYDKEKNLNNDEENNKIIEEQKNKQQNEQQNEQQNNNENNNNEKNNNKKNNIEKNNNKKNKDNKNIKNYLNYINNLPFICKALKLLSSKNIKKLFSLFEIPVNNNNIEKESNIDINKNGQSDNIEYDKYLNTGEIFTLLSLIGCKILTKDLEKEMMIKLKHQIINETYLPKDDFYRFHFWFEEEFEYLNFNSKKVRAKRGSVFENKGMLKKWERKKEKRFTNSDNDKQLKNNEEDNRNNLTTIKDFLFNIWKDENGNNFNIKEFINTLIMTRYINTNGEYNEFKYYDIIFGE